MQYSLSGCLSEASRGQQGLYSVTTTSDTICLTRSGDQTVAAHQGPAHQQTEPIRPAAEPACTPLAQILIWSRHVAHERAVEP